MRRLTLTNRLLLLIVAALLPVTLVLFYNLYVLRNAAEREAHESVFRTGQLVSLEMQRIVTGLHNLLIAVSAAPSVLEQDQEKCTALLARLSRKHPAISSLGVADPDGRVRCRQEARGVGVSLADRPYFQAALKTDELVIGGYTKGRVTGNAVLPLAQAIRNESGKLLGVAILAVNLSWLDKQIGGRSLPDGAALTVADRDGVIIARHPQPERFVGTRIPDAYIHLVHAAEPGTIELTSQDGMRRILAYFSVSTAPSGLYVSTGISAEQQFSALRSATLTGLVASFVALLLSLLLYWNTSRRAIRLPMNRILKTIAAWREATGTVRSGMSRSEGEFGAIGAAIDELLDELDESREKQNVLVAELGHRMKNTLALVSTVATRTFVKGAGPDAARAAFQERLSAIAGAYDVLAKGEWHSAPLAEVVNTALRPFVNPTEPQVRIRGDDVVISSSAALAFAMAVHELATNAAKYGALSVADGEVAVDWRVNVAERLLHFRWEEAGGPKVEQPETKGFGSMLLKRALAAQLDAVVEVEFAPFGLSCSITAPLDRIAISS